ncbi:sugar phosphate isomerase/epimerase family protein [Candidatus Pelagibacter sp. HIMB1695]|uniref:sugar phosphate isomerase/epimerase family protein n=1 Tax=Candidatus Pelagibacter sp. HIMB1695 TaxID=3413364 RepID=UPI003F831AC0
MKFGITQGRLTNEKKGVLQKFPRKWNQEFTVLHQTNLDYIELFLENKINKKNPIWSKEGQRKLLKNLNKTNINHHIVCDNFIIDKSLDDVGLIKYYKKLFKNIKLIKCKLLIIPLINKNFLKKNVSKLLNFLVFLDEESKKHNLKISLEINEDFRDFKKILSITKIKDIKITFDTGNFFLKNKNVLNNLKSYYPYINHIHLKDRNKFGENVIFGDGEINFKSLFKFLKNKKYNNFFTFETNRGDIALQTANNNLKIVRNLI